MPNKSADISQILPQIVMPKDVEIWTAEQLMRV